MNFVSKFSGDFALANGSGTATRNGATIDTQGFDRVAFACIFGTIAGSGDFKLQGSGDASAWNDLEGATLAYTAANDDDLFVLDLLHPRQRYVRCVVTKDGSNSSTESVAAFKYNGTNEPTTQPVGTSTKIVHAPAAA